MPFVVHSPDFLTPQGLVPTWAIQTNVSSVTAFVGLRVAARLGIGTRQLAVVPLLNGNRIKNVEACGASRRPGRRTEAH